MSAVHGSLFVLVNVDKHRDVMGDIVRQLVTDYGVPVSIVDNIQKICPKCSCTPTSIQTDSSPTTPTLSIESPKEAPPKVVVSVTKAESPQKTIVSKRQESTPPKEVCEPKRGRFESEKYAAKKSLTPGEDDANEVLTVLAALQNSNHDLQQQFGGGSENNSDDGASNSSNIYDGDDDDYKTSPWANPDFLTNFITSQPNIFAGTGTGASGQKNTSSNSSSASSSVMSKRNVPPILTANGKTRRGRIVYSQHELTILEKFYEEDPNACADHEKRDQMCSALDIDYHRLKVWFQNRRRKDKVRSQEEAGYQNTSMPSGLDFYETPLQKAIKMEPN